MKKKNKESLLAHCDLTTGKIYGCTRGSWKWWHEKAHFIYNENPETSNLLMLKEYIFYLWMGAVCVALKSDFFVLVPIFLLVVLTFFTIHEENWCNKYANEHHIANKRLNQGVM